MEDAMSIAEMYDKKCEQLAACEKERDAFQDQCIALKIERNMVREELAVAQARIAELAEVLREKRDEKKKCPACNGSGRYDVSGSPKCGACAGTGRSA